MLTTRFQNLNSPLIGLCAAFFILLLARSLSQTDTNSPTALLERVLQSEERVSFEGTSKVILLTKKGKIVTWTRVVSIANVITRTDYLGPGRERGRIVVSEGNERLEYDPSIKQAVVSHEERKPNSAKATATTLRRLKSTYDLTINDQVKPIHGRAVIVLKLNPKLMDRPTTKWWVDAETAHIVRREIYDVSGRFRQLSQTDIKTYDPRTKPELLRFALPHRAKVTRRKTNEPIMSVQNARKDAPRWCVIPEFIGDGFEFDHARIVSVRGVANIQIQYTDGLIGLSLFESPSKYIQKRLRKSHTVNFDRNRVGIIEQISPYNVLTWMNRDHTFHLVGDVAEQTLVDIAQKLGK